MNLGKILGSISPAFGMLSGQGLGQHMGMLSPAFMLMQMLGKHGQQDGGNGMAPTPPMPPTPEGGMGLNIDPSMMQTGQPHRNTMFENSIMGQRMQQGGNFLGRLGGGY